MTLSEAFDEFIIYKSGYCLPRSVQNYKDFILPFINSIGKEKEIESFCKKELYDFLSSINSARISSATKATYIRNIKIFLRWCESDLDIEFEKGIKVSKIKLPKQYKKEIHLLTPEEIKLLFNIVSGRYEWLTVRNKLIIALMYDSGLRQGEIVTLCRNNIFIDENYMIVVGKGNKQRIVPLGSVSKSLMIEYIKLCPYNKIRLFVGRSGEDMTCNSVKLLMSKLDKQLPFHVASHMLRHNFATNYLLNQLEETGVCDIYSLMTIMGHEEASTTMVYLHHAQSQYASRHYKSNLDKMVFSNL